MENGIIPRRNLRFIRRVHELCQHIFHICLMDANVNDHYGDNHSNMPGREQEES